MKTRVNVEMSKGHFKTKLLKMLRASSLLSLSQVEWLLKVGVEGEEDPSGEGAFAVSPLAQYPLCFATFHVSGAQTTFELHSFCVSKPIVFLSSSS